MEHTHNPHDRLFKAAFSNTEVAKSYLRDFLPKQITSKLDFESLELVPGSHVSPKLEEYFSDIIYECKFEGQETLLSLLLEHKSAVPKFPHLQLLRYMLELWEKEASEKENTVLRPVIPIIVYHGKRGWKKKPFYDSFPTLSESLRSFIPAFEYLLTDLRNWSDEGLRVLEAEILKKTLLLFKHYGEDEYVREHFEFLFTFRDANVEDEQIRSIIISFFVYLTLTTDLEREEFISLVRKLPSTNTDITMTLHEKIVLYGKQEKENQVISNCLKAKLSLEMIAELTGLSMKEVKERITKLGLNP